jgi:acetyltransferase-like isoleucine patch superfamily enzyme
MTMLTPNELAMMGFASLGKNVQISDKVSIYGVERIWLGNNVRIDDFSVLSAGEEGIEIGSYVHIGVGCSLTGSKKITLSNFSGISSRVSIFTSSDDYSGLTLTNPTVPMEFKNVKHASVFLGRHVIVGSGSVILPGVHLEDGVAIGALSMVAKNCKAFGIYTGNPLRRIKERKHDLLQLEYLIKKSDIQI